MGRMRKTVKIRKPHRCASCSEYFPKNTKMVTTLNAEDGGYRSIYRCEPCQETVDKIEINRMVDTFNGIIVDSARTAEFNSTLDPLEYLKLKREERNKKKIK